MQWEPESIYYRGSGWEFQTKNKSPALFPKGKKKQRSRAGVGISKLGEISKQNQNPGVLTTANFNVQRWQLQTLDHTWPWDVAVSNKGPQEPVRVKFVKWYHMMFRLPLVQTLSRENLYPIFLFFSPSFSVSFFFLFFLSFLFHFFSFSSFSPFPFANQRHQTHAHFAQNTTAGIAWRAFLP